MRGFDDRRTCDYRVTAFEEGGRSGALKNQQGATTRAPIEDVLATDEAQRLLESRLSHGQPRRGRGRARPRRARARSRRSWSSSTPRWTRRRSPSCTRARPASPEVEAEAGAARDHDRRAPALPQGHREGSAAHGGPGGRAREAHRARRARREAGDGRGEPPTGRLHRQALPQPGPAVPRPHPGGDDRARSRGRRSSTTARASSSRPTRPGGSARRSRGRSRTRDGRFGCRCTWSRSSTGSSARSASSVPSSGASR